MEAWRKRKASFLPDIFNKFNEIQMLEKLAQCHFMQLLRNINYYLHIQIWRGLLDRPSRLLRGSLGCQ